MLSGHSFCCYLILFASILAVCMVMGRYSVIKICKLNNILLSFACKSDLRDDRKNGCNKKIIASNRAVPLFSFHKQNVFPNRDDTRGKKSILFTFSTIQLEQLSTIHRCPKRRTLRKVMGGMGKKPKKIHARENAKKKNSCKEERKEKKFMQKEGPIVIFI